MLCRTRADRTLTTFCVSLREMAKMRRVLLRSLGNSGRRSSSESLLGRTSRKNTPILSTEMGMTILCQPATFTKSWWTTKERVSWTKKNTKNKKQTRLVRNLFALLYASEKNNYQNGPLEKFIIVLTLCLIFPFVLKSNGFSPPGDTITHSDVFPSSSATPMPLPPCFVF